MNKSDTAKLLAVIGRAWPTFREEIKNDPNEEILTFWHMTLSTASYEEAHTALGVILRSGNPFAPKPGQILQQVSKDAIYGVDENLAWEEVLREIRRVGANPSPSWAGGERIPAPVLTFSHPCIYRAVQAVGWKDICMSTKLGVERAHFSRALEAAIEKYRTDVQVLGRARADENLALDTAPVIRDRLSGGGLKQIMDINYDPNEPEPYGDADRERPDNGVGHVSGLPAGNGYHAGSEADWQRQYLMDNPDDADLVSDLPSRFVRRPGRARPADLEPGLRRPLDAFQDMGGAPRIPPKVDDAL